MAIYAWSDIHIDFPQNMAIVESLTAAEFKNDYLLVAGDVTDKAEHFKRGMSHLVKVFRRIFFVPGNHDLWLHKNDYEHSLHKFEALMALCAELGVMTTPQRLLDGDQPVWVLPLFSWYSGPEEGEDSLFIPKVGEDPQLRMWTDKYRVKWPEWQQGDYAANYFIERNRQQLPMNLDAPVISFSHFLPRAEVMVPKDLPDGIIHPIPNDPHPEFNFTRVAGSTLLLDQLNEINSTIHVYGHQHRNRWKQVAGRYYVSHCLGYPKEPQISPTGDTYRPLKVWPMPDHVNELEAYL